MSQQINLFNPIFLKQKKHFSSRTMLQGLAMVAVSVAAVYGLQLYQLGALRAQERTMRAQAQQATQQLVAASGGKASKAIEDEIKRAESDLKTLQGLSGAVETEMATGNAGFSRYLAAFARQPVGGLWLTGFTVAGEDLEVRGRAVRAELLPVFLRKLAREELLKGKGFTAVSVTARSAEPAKAAPAQAGGAPQPERFVEFSLATRDKKEPQ
jgi:type IV pilus assembly PilN-like protein